MLFDGAAVRQMRGMSSYRRQSRKRKQVNTVSAAKRGVDKRAYRIGEERAAAALQRCVGYRTMATRAI